MSYFRVLAALSIKGLMMMMMMYFWSKLEQGFRHGDWYSCVTVVYEKLVLLSLTLTAASATPLDMHELYYEVRFCTQYPTGLLPAGNSIPVGMYRCTSLEAPVLN